MNDAKISMVNIPERWSSYWVGSPPYFYYDVAVGGIAPSWPGGGVALHTSCDVTFSGGLPKGGATYFSTDNVASNYPYFQVTTNTVVPYVSFQDALVKGQTAASTVSLSGPSTPYTVNLSLAPTTGTGAAVFAATNTSTMSITLAGGQSQAVQITGVAGGSVAANMQLSASVSGVQRGATFSVIDATLSCTSPVTRGQSTTCQVSNGPTGVTYSWKFTDGNGNVVTPPSNSSSSWQGTMVTGGTVTATIYNTIALAPASITVDNRTNFAFTAVNPTPLTPWANSITCYDGSIHDLSSPPAPGSFEGYSCADMAFTPSPAQVADGGPNNGYWYVTAVSDVYDTKPTKFEYTVVSDLRDNASTFYTSQCGDYSSSNSAGFIAGSQLNQNVFDHEQGSVLSHWTEYRDAQNDSNNNIGTVLEPMIAAPGITRDAYVQNLTTAGNDAMSQIAQAVAVEPCNGVITYDSSQSCKYCGTINYTPYQSCSNPTPLPYCQ